MRPLVAIFLFMLQLPTARASDFCGGVNELSAPDASGRSFALTISHEVLEGTIKWISGTGVEPPLSVTQAFRAAAPWAKDRFGHFQAVHVQGVTLRRYQCSSVTNRWYYRIDYVPVANDAEIPGAAQWVVVLMDGTVVAPTLRANGSN